MISESWDGVKKFALAGTVGSFILAPILLLCGVSSVDPAFNTFSGAEERGFFKGEWGLDELGAALFMVGLLSLVTLLIAIRKSETAFAREIWNGQHEI